MLQVFTDECRACFQARKGFKLLPLWLRTLGDLMVNVIKEHVSNPQRAAGLMEAVPNAPLPWKGVFLVLVPGLIFFVSQVAELNGEDWFYLMVYRAAYVLIIPVLVVWIWKRKFPIWGLVPLGLLFKTLLDIFWRRFQSMEMEISNLSLFRWIEHTKLQPPLVLNLLILITIFLSIIGLLWLARRRAGISRAAWVWLGIFCLLVILNFGANFKFYTTDIQISPKNYLNTILGIASYNNFYNYGGYLVLILMGALLAKRHGRLAMLLPLGFLLPTIIYGRVSNNWPDVGTVEFGYMLSVAVAVLVYRFFVALAAPVWIVRSATGKMQRRAGVISIATLLVIQLAFNLGMIFYYGLMSADPINYVETIIFDQLIFGTGLALAIALYGTVPNTQSAQQEMDILAEETSVHNI
jgi:hypothetical protein